MQAEKTELYHGGDLDAARRSYPDSPEPWIDLSTGINPWAYPAGPLAAETWQRLPSPTALASLAKSAAGFYGALSTARVVAAPGSQALIQRLPRLVEPARVAIVGFTYREHERCWRLAGHEVATAADLGAAVDAADVVVLASPNNPDGRLVPPERLEAARAQLAARDGLLVVDEAFAEVAPAASVAPWAGRPGLCVLRSFGKFFGLAGLRLGFALCPAELGERLAADLGPWPVSGPALAIGRQALEDTAWSAAARETLAQAAARLDTALAAAGLAVVGGTVLFRLVEDRRAAAIFETLCRHGILVRPFPERPQWLRFGLPPDAKAEARLAHALRDVSALREATGR